jgi:hypothetical protein
MTKPPKPKPKPKAKAKAKAKAKPQPQYHCRCYALDSGVYEMWVYDPATGTSRGPIPCTKEQCISCNKSAAVIPA